MKHPLNVGDSFTIRDENGFHLHFIIAESSPEKIGMVMAVYMSSANTTFKDSTTIVRYGEHPFVDSRENESWIKYQNPLLFLRAELDVKICDYYGPICQELLERIQDGICHSSYCPKRIKRIFREWNQERLLRS